MIDTVRFAEMRRTTSFLTVLLVFLLVQTSVPWNVPPASAQYARTTDPGSTGPYPLGTLWDQTFTDSYGNEIRCDIYYPAQNEGAGTPVSADAPFPLIVFGRGFSTVEDQYLWFGDHHGRWGYVVIILDFPGGAMQVDHAVNAQDMIDAVNYALDLNQQDTHTLHGAIDPERIGLAGFSMGGRAALVATSADHRVKTFVALAPANITNPGIPPDSPPPDPALQAAVDNISVPGQIQMGSKDEVASPSPHHYYACLAGVPKNYILINGGNHYQYASGFSSSFGDGTPDISEEEQQAVANKYSVAHFNYYLKQEFEYYDYLYGTEMDSDVSAGTVYTETNFTPWFLLTAMNGEPEPGYCGEPLTMSFTVKNDAGSLVGGASVKAEFSYSGMQATNITDSAGVTRITIQTPPAPGTYEVEVTATLGSMMGSSVYEVALENRPNYPPTVSSEPPQLTIEEDERAEGVVDLKAVFTDPDGDPLTFTEDSPDELDVSISAEGIVDIVPMADWCGSAAITFTARDNALQEASAVMYVTVDPVNDPPAAGDIPDVLMNEDTEYMVDFSGTFTDADLPYGDTLTYNVTAADPNISVEVNSKLERLKIVPARDWYGSCDITLTARDEEGGEASTAFSVTVENINDPPVAAEEKISVTMKEDDTLDIDLSEMFTDPDGDHIDLSVEGGPNIAVSLGEERAVLSPSLNWFGTETISIEACDPSGECATVEITAVVNPVNDPPELSSHGDSQVTLKAGEKYIFSADASDADGDILSYTWKMDGETVKVTAVPEWTYTALKSDAGEHNISLEVSDGTATSAVTWHVIIENNADVGTGTHGDAWEPDWAGGNGDEYNSTAEGEMTSASEKNSATSIYLWAGAAVILIALPVGLLAHLRRTRSKPKNKGESNNVLDPEIDNMPGSMTEAQVAHYDPNQRHRKPPY